MKVGNLEMYGFIYITTNMINGKRYIGKRRFTGKWKNYIGSGVNFKKALRKHGKENFYRDIVAIAYSEENLNKLEVEFIEFYNAVYSDNYYNIAIGGEGGNTLVGKSEEEVEEIKERISEAKIGKNNAMYGRQHNEETKKKMSQAKKGEKHPKAKKVICITTNEIFDTATKGGEFYGCHRSLISGCCRGKCRTAGKHPETGEKLVWMYYEDYIKEKQI